MGARVAYLILAHDNPRHLRRLVAALASDSSACFIHIDRKSRIEDFDTVATADNVHFADRRVAAHWADFSLVEATLVLLQQALAHSVRFERFVLLSGADYPLRSQAHIEDFFGRHPSTEYINLVAMPSKEMDKPLSRLTTYKHGSGDPFLVRFRQRVLFRLGLKSRHRDYRPVFGDLVPYAGDQWWALSREACESIVAFRRERPGVVEFFRHTSFPDEMFFQTVLGSSAFRPRIRRSVTYADWSAGGRHPAWLTEGHVEKFCDAREFVLKGWYGRGEALIARKCPADSEALVGMLDAMIAGKDGAPESR